MSELTSMMNIGKEMANKLISVGIESVSYTHLRAHETSV